MAPPQFRAFILCGPGMSLNTFTSNPTTHPKALLPIANRPMVWYPLQWCYRAGLSDITLITPPEALPALQAALSQNPHLTSMTGSRPTVLAPPQLTLTSSTADVFRLPEVQDAITGDFIVLPCDFICDIDCSDFLDAWLQYQAAVGGSGISKSSNKFDRDATTTASWSAGEAVGRRGAMTMYYSTADGDGKPVKGAETDFVLSVPASSGPINRTEVGRRVEKVVLTMSRDSLMDNVEQSDENVQVREDAMDAHPTVKVRSLFRDSNLYILPFWVKAYLAANDELESLGEDVVGWWARATWQDGVGHDLGFTSFLSQPGQNGAASSLDGDVPRMASTFHVKGAAAGDSDEDGRGQFARRVPGLLRREDSYLGAFVKPKTKKPIEPSAVPPVLAYFHPHHPTGGTEGSKTVTRVDTVPLLLATSLKLAALPTTTAGSTSPFAHPAKITHPDRVPRQCRVEQDNSLIGPNVTVGEHVNIKECVIGANCEIGPGARLFRCLLMDGVVVGENVTLSGCVVGFRARLEGGSRRSASRTDLRDSEIQEDMVISWGVDGKNETYMHSGLDDDFE